MENGGLAVGAIVGVLLLSLVLAVRHATVGSPRWVLRQLRRHGPDACIQVDVGTRSWTWDPSKPLNAGGARWGRASATYSWAAEDAVHLHYQPRTGLAEGLEGPVPDALRRNQRVMSVVLAVYGIALAIGFCVGFATAHGSEAERLASGGAGLLAAMMLVWMTSLLFGVVIAVFNVRRQMRRPPTW